MATRTGYVGTESPGDVLTAANFNKLPNGLIGYATANSNQTSITTAVDLTGLTVTLTPGTSRALRVGWLVDLQSNTATDNGVLTVLKDGSIVASQDVAVSSVDKIGSASGFFIDFAPTVASHVYKLQFARNGSSSGTWNTRASATELAWIAIWDDGPSF